ncbi:hypothetical protein RQP46_011397 [Phenoliferia psychrophenolica]
MFYAAMRTVESTFQSDRMREEAPEITRASFCAGAAKGFGNLVSHFAYEPVFFSGEMRKPEDYPILPNAEISRRWGLDATSGVPASRGERAWQDAMLLQRHLYLVRLACCLMDELDGVVTQLTMPMRQSTLPTPPALAARFAARGYVVVGADGVRRPSPAACLDKDFLQWGGSFICQHCFRPEDDLKLKGEGKMRFCGPCRKIERAWAFCSEECQRKNWKSHKKTCGKLFSETLNTPIFPPAEVDDVDPPSKHPTNALLAQQISLHRQLPADPATHWNVQVDPGPAKTRKDAILLRLYDPISRKLYDEFRDVAIATREPTAIAWLFVSLVTDIGPSIGLPDDGSGPSISDITPSAFTQQFLTQFDLPFDTFLAALPSTPALLARSVEHANLCGRELLKFTDGKWSGYVLSMELRRQFLSARDVGPTAVWAVIVPTERGGAPRNIYDVVAPVSHKAHKALRRAFGEGTIGTIGAVAALFVEVTALCKFGVGSLQLLSLEDFKNQYCNDWRVGEEELDAAVLELRVGAVRV